MPRWFNTAGSCNEANHYMLPVTRRLPGVRRLVDRQSYFILHSPRQVGKTDRSHSSSPFNIKDASLTLGLVRPSSAGGLVIANPIYREVIPRSLASVATASLPQIPATWLTSDGHIDEPRLLAAFLELWRQHGEPLLVTAPYSTATSPDCPSTTAGW